MTEDIFTKLYGPDAFDRPENWTDGTFKPKRVTSDSTPAPRRGFVRGYAFSDTSAPRTAQEDAAIAYAERSKRLEDAWRKEQHSTTATPTPTVDAAKLADAAYRERTERLANAWKNQNAKT
jgi:hypothetical protein